MDEVWKPVKNYEGLYEVSSLGRVKRLARQTVIREHVRRLEEKILRPGLTKMGYCTVSLTKNHEHKSFYLYHLVWDMFGDRQRNGFKLMVDHKDNDKRNCTADNLQLLTGRENCLKYYDTDGYNPFAGTQRNGKNWIAKIKIGDQQHYIGTYENREDAAQAFRDYRNGMN